MKNFFHFILIVLSPVIVALTAFLALMCSNATCVKTNYDNGFKKLVVRVEAYYSYGDTVCDTVVMSNYTFKAVTKRPALHWYKYTVLDTVR